LTSYSPKGLIKSNLSLKIDQQPLFKTKLQTNHKIIIKNERKKDVSTVTKSPLKHDTTWFPKITAMVIKNSVAHSFYPYGFRLFDSFLVSTIKIINAPTIISSLMHSL
jgi:hypothetical protein